MTKYKIVIGIIMTVVTLSCIIASSFAWFTASRDTVDGTGASMTAKDPSILTVSEDVFTIQDMGNYKGQTGFAFYRYIEEENNPTYEGKYILDKSGNKITKTFNVYDFEAELRESKEFTFNSESNVENTAIYPLTVTTSTVSGISVGTTFLLKTVNHFEYSDPADDFYLRNIDGNTLYILDNNDNVRYDNYLQTITINRTSNIVTVTLGGTSRITCKISGISQNYTIYENTDNTQTKYDRLVSTDENKRYSIIGVDGSVAYDSLNEGTDIDFDSVSKTTTVEKLVRKDSGTCKKVYTDSDGNINYESDKFRIVTYNDEARTFYKIYDKSYRPTCIYDGEYSGATISISEREVTTYAIDDGKDMEDTAYNVAIQFEMVLKASANTEYYLQFSSNTLGIVPVNNSAKDKLLAEGATTQDVYYTYIDSNKILFGLDISEDYFSQYNKKTTVNNYEKDCKTITNVSMSKLDASVHGQVCYETSKGYKMFYSSDNGETFQDLTYGISINEVAKYAEIRGEKVAYEQEKHGDIIFSLKTTSGVVLLVRNDIEYSSIFDEKGNLINDTYKGSQIFVYNQDGANKCAVYTEISEDNRARIESAVQDNNLYVENKVSVVYDSKGEEVLYSADNGNTIATTKRLIYMLPLDSFFENFTLEVDLIDHTFYSQDSWDKLTPEEKKAKITTYKTNADGQVVDQDGNLVAYGGLGTDANLLLYCVARIYYSDSYTLENLNSEKELKYNYDYAQNKYVVESIGNLKEFAYSDYSFMGSHFLIRLNVESGEKGGN